MNCAKCQQPIDENAEYWWGRHGGEWHPACFAQVIFEGGVGTGMWRNSGLAGPDPKEYMDEWKRLRATGKSYWEKFRDKWLRPKSDEPVVQEAK